MISLGLAQDVLQENHDKFLPILFEPFIDREGAIWTEPFFFSGRCLHGSILWSWLMLPECKLASVNLMREFKTHRIGFC